MWVKLDDGFWSNPKVLNVGNEGAGVFARMLSYSGQHDLEGAIPGEVARFIGKTKALNALVDAGLVERIDNGFLIPDFLEFNLSREEAEQRRRDRAEAGRRGGLASAKAKAQASAKANGRSKR